MMTAPGIVALGNSGPLAKSMRKVPRRLRGEVRTRYAPRLKRAPLVGRVKLEWAIEREAREELAKIFPPGALYASQGQGIVHNHSPQPTPAAGRG